LIPPQGSTEDLAFLAYGALITLRLEGLPIARILEFLPPGYSPVQPTRPPDVHLYLRQNGSRFDIERVLQGKSDLIQDGLRENEALARLELEIEATVAGRTQDYLFIHAAVCHTAAGEAIILPGRTGRGKSTLVSALCNRGAVYSSDEFAPLRSDGLVTPYPRNLSLKGGGSRMLRPSPQDLRYSIATEPAPVKLIVFSQFDPHVERWSPTELSKGNAVLEILANTVAAQKLDQSWLQTLSNVAQNARAVKAVRGDADQAASQILESMGQELI
jgi:hypothetical protein